MTIDPKINPVVAALPGGGWVAEFEEDGSIRSYPLVGWLVLADGQVTPMDASVDGAVDDPRSAVNFVRLHHPDIGGTD